MEKYCLKNLVTAAVYRGIFSRGVRRWQACTKILHYTTTINQCIDVSRAQILSFATLPLGNDILVIGLYGILLEISVDCEVTGAFPEDALIEVLKGGITVNVVGCDSGPIVAISIASGHSGNRSSSRVRSSDSTHCRHRGLASCSDGIEAVVEGRERSIGYWPSSAFRRSRSRRV